MKRIIALWLAALMLAAQPVQAAVCVGFGQSATKLSVSENFDDHTNLASIDTLHGWVHPNEPDDAWADARSVTDQVVGTSSRRSLAYWGADVFAADQKACLTVKALGTGGPAVRIEPGTSAGRYWVSTSGGNYILLKGWSITLATYGGQSVGDVVCLSATGTSTTTLTVSINGIDQTPYDDSSTPHTSGQPGVEMSGNIFYGDDWTAEEL